ncbi:PAS domain S-box-containing protein [Sphaerotilus hippei]|uniref:histidine kinase n=1 Tax=Sphaerotilus hippei TaxID=744406 RepID=A0A318H6F0_9BURK|nr:PAS domain S-box protein [Sphaerotilus hippei]PXW99567.1 PAS domain S-box-containing protein [Sphaerotilus hippei]
MLLTNVLDALPIPVAMLDREGRILRVNQRLLDVSRWGADELVGQRVLDVSRDFGGPIHQHVQTVCRSGEALRGQVLSGAITRDPGLRRTWHVDFSPLHDDHGELAAVLMVMQEVTEQLAREQALTDNLAHLRRVLDSLFAFVGVLQPDGTLIEANRAPLQAAGLTWDDVVGRKFWDCHWWSHDAGVSERCRDSVRRAAAGETVRFDVPVRMAGGELMEIDYMIAPMCDEQGRITHLIPSGADITARLRTEQGLLRSERRFRELFESVPEGLAVVDEQGIIVQVNAHMERLCGSSRQELEGSPVHRLIPARFAAAHSAHMAGYWTRPTPRQMGERILWLQRRDGSELPVEAGLTPVPSASGRQVLVTLTDCSQREAAKAQIEGALKEKTVLLNEVHHRVKNNLQVVSSLLSLQLRTVPAEVRQPLSAAQGRVRAMALIHQLLYEGKDYAQIDLTLYVQKLLRLLRESHVPAGAPIELVATMDPVPIWLDLPRAVPCGLLINELVTNALKHAFPETRRGQVGVVLASTGARARLVVRDDGVGLPPEVRFEDHHSSLGLQLVPLLAEQLGASVTLHREAGCSFEFEFAVQEAT